MASQIIAPNIHQWLAERGYVIGARVGHCTKAYHQLGVIVAVSGFEAITVVWDDGSRETCCWLHLSPNGYVLSAEDMPAAQPELLTVVDGYGYWSAAA